MRILPKLLVLVLVASSVVLLWLQNQQPISLKMFGFYQTPSLGLAVWMLFFTFLGIITSLLLQGLLSFGSNNKQKVTAKKQVKEEVKNTQSKPPEQPYMDWVDEPQTSEPWGNPNPPISQPQVTSPPPPAPVPPEPPETPETPEPPAKSTYSYSYAKATPQEKRNTKDQIYDTPYRIITPPYNDNSPPPPASDEDEDEEEWV
jgi:hypothetical protein